jgi:hypothetical protein
MSVVRTIRDFLVILACLCVLILTAEAFYLQAKVAGAVSQLQDRMAVVTTPPTDSGDPSLDGCDPAVTVC